jgi:hypothetical protein
MGSQIVSPTFQTFDKKQEKDCINKRTSYKMSRLTKAVTTTAASLAPN